VTRATEIIELMQRAVPAGQRDLDDAAKARLRDLTSALLAAKPEALEEYTRFVGVKQRSLCLPEAELAGRLRGATVLVTGGTGCIGSTLMAQLAAREPGRLVSVSRGISTGWPRQAGADYLYADVRDRRRVDRLISEIRPDVVFHVAAQRSPALAEVEVHRTVSTNVLGGRNVLAAAAEAGVAQVVCASTGKALRPYSPEMYTASKRAAEWVASSVAAEGRVLCSAARFTHVIDNSIVYERLLDWADGEDAVIRLHSAGIAFYVQSALESAQLLLLAFLGAQRGEFRMFAIKDLGWPVGLLDVALGVLAHKRSRTPVYISGYDPGYEEVPFPGLYDPATAGDVSPLINAFEAATAAGSSCPRIDGFRLEMAPDPTATKLLGVLEGVCERTQDPGAVRHALDDLSWSLLDATLAAADCRVLARTASLITQHRHALSPVHRRVMQAIMDHAEPAAAG
jgi:NAD(P)-dependent dehydrogenase (short-subunit alcohol dehydrogenase family)